MIRCRRCRTYVNPFVKFSDNGRRWRCNVCNLVNDVPSEYVCELDSEGNRRDRMQRPELHMGAVEFVAAQEYMVRPPQPPVFMFLVEVSYNAVASGMLRCVAATIQHTLERLPGGERTQVGLITFDSTLHFYNVSGSAPQMIVVSEVDEVFLPLPDDLLVNLAERSDVVTNLFERLPHMFAQNQCTEVALGPALKAALQVSQHVGGKLHVFTCTRPTVGDGKLRNREGGAPRSSSSTTDPARKGEGATANLLQPDNDFFKTFAVECSKQQAR